MPVPVQSESASFFICVYKCLCGIRVRESERWSERSPLHTGSEMGIWGGGVQVEKPVSVSGMCRTV